jgi:hypothetical protein
MGRVYAATDSNGDGTWDITAAGDDAFGCLIGVGVGAAGVQTLHDAYLAERGAYGSNELILTHERVIDSLVQRTTCSIEDTAYWNTLIQGVSDDIAAGGSGALSADTVQGLLE